MKFGSNKRKTPQTHFKFLHNELDKNSSKV